MPDDICQVTSEHIRAFLVAERQRTSPAFAEKRSVPEVVKPFSTEAEITALLRACIGQDFESRRDAAIIRILADTAVRVPGLAGLRSGAEDGDESYEEGTVPGFISDSPLARGLVRIGDEAIAREDDAKLRDYFADDYVLHGPGGDLGFEELRAYFASLRAAFSNLRLVREQIIADGRYLAARNTFSGDFTDVFTSSPIGPVEPTGEHVEWEVINTFRYDDEQRLAEEWVQTDYRSFLIKLGVTARQSAERRTNTS